MLLPVMFGFIFASVALTIWALFPDLTQQSIRQRLLSEVATEQQPKPLDTLVRWLQPLNRWLPLGWYNAPVSRLLESAGVRLSPMHFLVLQECGAGAGFIVYAATIGMSRVDLTWLIGLMATGACVPYLWIRNQITSRRLLITRDLPEVADLLNLCVGAGSDFMGSMARIVREFRPCPLRQELTVILQEIRVGKRRRDALKAFADRVKTAEASTFARTLIQVDRMGTGLADALKILSEDMRLTRYHWAERFAQQAPLKMLIPLLCSMASALIIIAGPILLQFMQGGFGMVPGQ